LPKNHYEEKKQAMVSLRVSMAKSSMVAQRRTRNEGVSNSIYSKNYEKFVNRSMKLDGTVLDWESSKAVLLMKINRLTEDNKKLKLKNAIMSNRISALEGQITSTIVISIIIHLVREYITWIENRDEERVKESEESINGD